MMRRLMYPVAPLLICIAVLALQPSSIFCSALTLGGSLEKGFELSPSQISLQWGTYRPFLASPQGTFTLGFEGVDGGYVLAIMYTIRPTSNATALSSSDDGPPLSMEMVWSANGNSPCSQDAIFSISPSGNLMLNDEAEESLWATGTTNTGLTKLLLQDSGNLILSYSTTVPSAPRVPILWQSFDHPTDTLLQGQNFTASMRLTSSLGPRVPGTANAYFKMEVDGIALYADLGRNASQLMYWMLEADQETGTIDSGNATTPTIYARMDAMGYLGLYEAEDDRVSFETFETYNSSDVSYRRLKLDSDGNLRVYYWTNGSWEIDFIAVSEPCKLPSPCGAFGLCGINGLCMCPAGAVMISNSSSGGAGNASFNRVNASDAARGCALANPDAFPADGCPLTGKSSPTSEVFFMELEGVDSVFHPFLQLPQVNVTSVEACEEVCRSDCSCAAFFYSKGSASKCFLAYQSAELSLMQTGHIDDVAYIRLSKPAVVASETTPQQAKRSKSVAGLIVGLIAGCLIISAALCALAAWRRHRSKSKFIRGGDMEKKAFLSEIPGLPAEASYREIEARSGYFKRYRRAGSLGNLYEGTLAGGTQVAIARLTLQNVYDLHSVKLTLASVGRMTHCNLARLCAYSIEGANLALCYELPPNGWLDLQSLRWQQRVTVATGVAQALAALHEEARMVHGLLNPEVVFVAGGSEAKLAGVGVAELIACGLAAPAGSAIAGPKMAEPPADVLEFGILLTYLMTSQRVDGDAAKWRLRWRDAIGQRRTDQLLDPAIVADATSASGDQLARFATSAGLCLHPSPLQRPSMGTVIRILDGSLTPLPLI